MSDTCVVVLTRNRVELLVPVLETISCWPDPCYLIVVDNASTDGTAETVSDRFPEIDLVVSETNLGATGGRNLGVHRAHELGFSTVFIAEDDTIPSLLAFEITCTVLAQNLDAVLVGSSGGVWERGMPRWGRYGAIRPGEIDVRHADFVHLDNCAIRVTSFLQAGALRDDYFIMFEEPELGWRIRQLGGDILVAVTPVERLTVGAASSSGSHPWRAYYQTRNFLRFCLDSRSPAVCAGFCTRTLNQFAHDVLHRRWRTLWYRAQGAYDASLGRMGMRLNPEGYSGSRAPRKAGRPSPCSPRPRHPR